MNLLPGNWRPCYTGHHIIRYDPACITTMFSSLEDVVTTKTSSPKRHDDMLTTPSASSSQPATVHGSVPDVSGALTTDLIEKLIVIDRIRRERGLAGIAEPVYVFIRELEGASGFAPEMGERLHQVQRLWDHGWGRQLGCTSFADYLATIPALPNIDSSTHALFPLWVLVDGRLALTDACKNLGVELRGCDEPTTGEELPTDRVYWMRCQDGARHRGRDAKTAFALLGNREEPLSIVEGLALFAQFPECVRESYLDLAASHHQKSAQSAGCLGRWQGRVALRWRYATQAHPDCGMPTKRLL